MADVLPRRNLPEDAEPWGRRIEEIVGRLSDNMSVVTTNVRTQLTNASRGETSAGARLSQLSDDLATNVAEVAEAMSRVAEVEQIFAEGGEFEQQMSAANAEIELIKEDLSPTGATGMKIAAAVEAVAAIGDLESDFQDANARIQAAEEAVDALEAQLAPGGAFDTQIKQAAADVKAVQDSLKPTGTVGKQLADNSAALSDLTADLAGLDSAVADLNADVANAVSTAESAQTAASNAASAAETAKTAADAAKAKADAAASDLLALSGKTGRLIRSTTAPTAAADKNSNNLWLNTSNGQLSQWTGTAWTVITDSRLTAATNTADQAANLANNAKTAADNAQEAAEAAQSLANTAKSTADAAKSEAEAAKSAAATADSKAATAQSAAATAQGKANQAATDAANAAGIANGKADVLIQSTAPATAMRKATTLWIDTTGGANTPKRWSGSAWVEVTDKAAKDAAAAAASAQSTANQAVTDAGNAKDAADAAAAAALKAQSAADDASAKATTASGLVTVASANPTTADAAGKPIGALWYVRSGGTMLRQYTLTGVTTWTLMADDATTKAKAAADAAATAASNAQTSANEANTAASNALTAANTANTAAGNALTAANKAQTTANGKNKIVRSTAAASTPANYVAGDQWWQYSGTQIIAMWLHSGSAWVAQTLTDSIITNLNAGTITAGTLAADRIAASSITGAKIAANTITASNVAAATITAAEIAASTITGAKIAANTITAANVAANTITANEMKAGTITAASGILANLAVGTAQLQDSAITRAKIGSAAVGTAEIADAAITNAKIGDLDAGKITAGILNAARIGASSITAEKLLVSAGNLFPDPYMRDSNGWPGTGVSIINDSDFIGGRALQIVGATGQRGSYYSGVDSNSIDLAPGATYRLRCKVKVTGAAGNLNLYFRTNTGTSTLSSVRVVSTSDGLGTFNVDTTWTIPSNVLGYGTVGFHTQGPYVDGATFAVGNVSIQSMADANLIVDGGILAKHLSADSVTANAIKAGTITATELATNAITADKISANAVTTAKIATNAVTANEIAANTITAANIKAGAITATEIAAGTITGKEIAANSITAASLAIGDFANRIPGVDKIAMVGRNGLTKETLGLPHPFGVNTDNNTFWLQGQKTVNLTSIISLEPGEYQVTAEVAASVSGTRYYFQLMPRTGQSSIPYIVTNQLAGADSTTFQQYTNSFTVSEAQSGEHVLRIYANHPNGTANPDGYQWFRNVSIRKRMGGELIVDGAITARNIQAGTITAAEIAGSTITGSKIAANTIVAGNIATNAITANELASNSVLATNIASNAVTSVKIAAGAVTAGKIAANAVTANEIKAGSIDGMQITGAVITSAAPGSANRTYMDSNGLTVYAGNSDQVKIGHGIETGMAVRQPGGAMVPLSRAVFGSQYAYREEVASYVIGPTPAGKEALRRRGNAGVSLTFTPWASILLVTFGFGHLMYFTKEQAAVRGLWSWDGRVDFRMNGQPIQRPPITNWDKPRPILANYFSGSNLVADDFGDRTELPSKEESKSFYLAATPGETITLSNLFSFSVKNLEASSVNNRFGILDAWMSVQQIQ